MSPAQAPRGRNFSASRAPAARSSGLRPSIRRTRTWNTPARSITLAAASVSDDFLPLLGVRPALGRLLDSKIDAGAQHPLAILISDGLWRRRFAADPGVIGRSVRINDVETQIAGVLPPGLRLFLPPSVNNMEQVDVWLPDRIDSTVPYRGVPLIARLRPGVTLDQANAELKALAARFEREYPDSYSGPKAWQASPFDRASGAGLRFTARLLHDEMTRDIRPALFVLAGAVAFVLLIACVNAANLMLARGAGRQRELEIRRALGAGTFRIVRQLISESLLLALASAAIGLFCARFGLEAIRRLSASHMPLQSRIEIDAPVALFALALSALTSVLFGLLPAWRLASDRTGHRAARGPNGNDRIGNTKGTARPGGCGSGALDCAAGVRGPDASVIPQPDAFAARVSSRRGGDRPVASRGQEVPATWSSDGLFSAA